MDNAAAKGNTFAGFLIDPEDVPEYQAPAPYRRSMKPLVDGAIFPGAPMCMALLTYPPGAACPDHSHPEAAEVYFVLEGELVATLNGEPLKVAQGKMIYIAPRTEHRAENRTGETCRFLAVHSPTVDDVAQVRRDWKLMEMKQDG